MPSRTPQGLVINFRKVFEALVGLPVSIIAATAGAELGQTPPLNVFIADYLPGIEAAARSKLVICNGGSPTSQQAIAAGVPVLGIASNMDQFLNMGAMVRAGAGRVLRADRVSAEEIRAAVTEMLASQTYAQAAANLAEISARYSATARFEAVIAQMAESTGSATTSSMNQGAVNHATD